MPFSDNNNISDKVQLMRATGIRETARANIESLTRRLERTGVDVEKARGIAQKTAESAEGAIAPDDWMNMRAELFSEDTQNVLRRESFLREDILADPNLAECYVGRVLELEGIPDGSGSILRVKGEVVSGHFEKRGDGGIGIDLVAANKQGVPIPIEVKKYKQTSAAHLENCSVGGRDGQTLEPETARWKALREDRVRARQQGSEIRIGRDEFALRPSVESWQHDLDVDELRMAEHSGEIPVQQMDGLWTRDRWLKIIKSEEGRIRLRQAGVAEKYLNYDKLRTSPNLNEWYEILEQRTTVIVSDSGGDTGKQLFTQAVREGRSKSVVKIEL